jgi:hypothetical protein
MYPTTVREKSIGMTRRMCTLPIFLAAVIALILSVSVPLGWAWYDDDGVEIPFDVANIFFELNDTDGDLGIHALIDGEAWKKIEIEDPGEHEILDIRVTGRLQRQGLTEIFFESAEPTFDELAPRRFFRRFPEGIYEIEGETLEGDELESEVLLTHTMPAPPVPTVNGEPMAEECDEDEPGYDATVVGLGDTVTIEWAEVTMSHPDPNGGGAGVQPPIPVSIINYEIVLEVELEVSGEEFTSVFSVVLPPDARSMTVPEEFIALGEQFKYEVLAREESGNQTAVESCLVIAE